MIQQTVIKDKRICGEKQSTSVQIDNKAGFMGMIRTDDTGACPALTDLCNPIADIKNRICVKVKSNYDRET